MYLKGFSLACWEKKIADNILNFFSPEIRLLTFQKCQSLSYHITTLLFSEVMSCQKKSYDHTFHNTLADTSNVMATSMSTMHFLLNNCQL